MEISNRTEFLLVEMKDGRVGLRFENNWQPSLHPKKISTWQLAEIYPFRAPRVSRPGRLE